MKKVKSKNKTKNIIIIILSIVVAVLVLILLINATSIFSSEKEALVTVDVRESMPVSKVASYEYSTILYIASEESATLFGKKLSVFKSTYGVIVPVVVAVGCDFTDRDSYKVEQGEADVTIHMPEIQALYTEVDFDGIKTIKDGEGLLNYKISDEEKDKLKAQALENMRSELFKTPNGRKFAIQSMENFIKATLADSGVDKKIYFMWD